jgi:hypothetical protein
MQVSNRNVVRRSHLPLLFAIFALFTDGDSLTVLELNAKLKDAEVKRISAEEKLKLLDAQLQRAQHQVTCPAPGLRCC